MSFYETPRRNASDSTTASNRSTHRGHRREHSDPCPLPSPGLPHNAVCIGSYARIIFVMVMFKAGEAREYLSGHGSRQARREAARKNTNVQAVRKNKQGKAISLVYEECIIHDA